MTAVSLGAWIAIYFGIGLIRASLSCSRAASIHHDPKRKLAVPGYCLLLIGVFLVGTDVFRHFHRSAFLMLVHDQPMLGQKGGACKKEKEKF